MSESTVTPKQIFLKKYDALAPRYKYLRVNLSNLTSSSVAVNPSTTSAVSFRLPGNTVYNLSKSRLRCDVPIPLQTGSLTSNMAVDYSFMDSISFETGNGVQLANIQSANRYTKIVTRVNTKISDYLTNDTSDMLFKQITTLNPVGATGGAIASAVAPFCTREYSAQFLINSGVNGNTGLAQTIQVNYPLSSFSHSIFSLDKNLYFGNSEMYIKGLVDAVDNWAYTSDDATLTTPVTLTRAIGNLTNFYLFLAVETHPEIIQKIVSAYEQAEGLKVSIEYPIVTRVTTPAATSQNIVASLTPSMGKYLKRIYHTVFEIGSDVSTFMDCSNLGGSKITSYRTYLDSQPLQDDLVDTSAVSLALSDLHLDSWRLNQNLCRNTALIDLSDYDVNFFHCDLFDTPNAEHTKPVPNENIQDGIAMKNGILYQYSATAAASLAFIHITAAIFTRDVRVTKEGVEFI